MAKILIVDDNPDLLEFLTLILRRREHEIESVFSGIAIREKILSFMPNIILMDVRLTGINGRELCREIKADKLTAGIKIILMSASSQYLENYHECNADAAIEKPFNIKTMYETVEGLF